MHYMSKANLSWFIKWNIINMLNLIYILIKVHSASLEHYTFTVSNWFSLKQSKLYSATKLYSALN